MKKTITAAELKELKRYIEETCEALEREKENERVETVFVKRTNTVRYNASKNSIELRMRNDNAGCSALIERELIDGEGFKRGYNEDGIAVLIKDWDGSREMLDAIAHLLDDTEVIKEKKLYGAEVASSTPKRVVYPLTAAQERAKTRKPTQEELDELSEIEVLADDYEFGYAAPVVKKETEIRIIKREELRTPEDFLKALAGIKTMFA